jgi:hypothetical protein
VNSSTLHHPRRIEADQDCATAGKDTTEARALWIFTSLRRIAFRGLLVLAALGFQRLQLGFQRFGD